MRKHLTSITLIISLIMSCFCLAGCTAEENTFPHITFSNNSRRTSRIETEEDYDSTSGLHEITVALPLSDETVNLLMKLYYAKNNDLFPADMTGADISIEYLDAINTPWVVNTITTTGTGESLDTLESLAADGIYPDLFLAADMNEMISEDMVIPFDQYLFNDDTISSSFVYLSSLDALRSGSEHYGLPFYSTVYLLTGSREYLPDSGIPAYNMNTDELIDYIEDIPGINSDGNTYVTRFYDADSLIPFLGEDIAETLSNEGLTSTTDNFGADPRVSRSCGMWLMNSGEFDTWSAYYPDGLYFTMLPSENVNAVVYPICLSSSCEDSEFAADFASFICFDKDAQMLLRRMETLRGYFPPISTDSVWGLISSDEQFGAQAMLYEQYMDYADYSVAVD